MISQCFERKRSIRFMQNEGCSAVVAMPRFHKAWKHDSHWTNNIRKLILTSVCSSL